MNIEIKEIRKRVFLLKFNNQYDITSTFMRLQEFYESPYKGIRGCYFTLEEYMDIYAKENGNFTYTTDWSGFNIPDNIVREFFRLFENKLLNKERNLLDKISFLLNNDEKFYLIGVYKSHDLEHEISHAYYYLDKKYKKTMNLITDKLDRNFFNDIYNKLLNMDYCKNVIMDEIQAYLATSNKAYLKRVLNLINIDDIVNIYKEKFNDKDKYC
ncbi:MAG: hypothetical protein M0Q13_02605 [Methanothrix sp.]|jgi:hypothetical protein|nr:hypothetical protein [Methanothrix sp.]